MRIWSFFVVAALCVGCASESGTETAASGSGSQPDAAAPPSAPGEAGASMLQGIPGVGGGAAEPPGAQSPASDQGPTLNPPAQAQGGNRVRAQVGVGKQGRSLDDTSGVGNIIAQPAKSLFAVKERTVFEFQIPKAVQLFQASNGRLPKSHDEFMTQIIKSNNIRLPQLPAGQRYVYDPQQGELMVEMPGN